MMGEKLTLVDLFAGTGGLSLGFSNAGVKVVAAIEKDRWACDTLEKNHPNVDVVCADIEELPDPFFSKYKGVDIVAGGPPCQGFSIAASNRREKNDKRNTLYLHFLRVVKLVGPKIVVFENVKEIGKFNNETGMKIVDDIYSKLGALGYDVKHFILNSSKFGVPQNRQRFFLIGTKGNMPDLDSINITNHTLLWDAISDLPKVTPREHMEGDIFDYAGKPKNQYQRKMREKSKKVTNHIPMRHTDRLIERFKYIRSNNSNNCIGSDHAPRKRGAPFTISISHYSQNHRRLAPNEFSPTITASFYSSFIHPYQNRNLTVREAARLQSFPDSYTFLGKRTTLSKKLLSRKGIFEDMHLDQFNQVGNAVPPIMAENIAKEIIKVEKSADIWQKY